MSKLTHKQAEAVIARIRSDNGGILPEDRANTPQRVLRSLRSVRRKLGEATKTLAKNLYSKDTRFVYELIQNAEDNSYTLSNSEAFVSFTIEADRIIIDSNEDGFTTKDVKAICSIGESTKRSVQGYIGEKGIGFKSVFKIAKKVHVQSGPFSFAFEYTRKPINESVRDTYHKNKEVLKHKPTGDSSNVSTLDSDNASTEDSDDASTDNSEDAAVDSSDDDGLGMVTPMEQAHMDLPAEVRTRITLTLTESPMTLERCNELFDLPDTLLLFLSKLKTIRINRHLPDEINSSTIYQYRFDPDQGLAVTTKNTCVGFKIMSTESLFHVVKKEITGLPPDEARPGKDYDRTTVVLAFPVDADCQPMIAPQHVFAFLPLRQVGFTFLVQADFITQASREDIFDSPRNRQLLNGVAETFRKAVLGFCQHPELAYHWIKYLPDESIADAFWKKLRPQIISILVETPILLTQSNDSLHKPAQLRIVSEDLKDSSGQPLFRDLPDAEIYLSQIYEGADLNSIKSLGVRVINYTEAFDRIKADLSHPKSRIKSDRTSEAWHKRVASYLSIPFEKGKGYLQEQIKRFPIIPLHNGKWVSAHASPIYFPTTTRSTIPQDLDLNLVSESATQVRQRHRLFTHLGVSKCPEDEVVLRIYSKYRLADWKPTNPHIHLHYLFENLPETNNDVNTKVWVLDRSLKRVWLSGHRKEYMYFEDPENPYGPGQLFPVENLDLSHRTGLFGSLSPYAVHFIHPSSATYPANTDRHGRTYARWLEEVLGVHRFPQMIDPLKAELSKEFAYIIKRCPEKLCTVLKNYWPAYRSLVSQHGIRETLKACKVPVQESDALVALSNTYLPLPKLRDVMLRAGVNTHPLFLKMPGELRNEDEEEWKCLNELGVGVHDDVRLYLCALARQAASSDGSVDANQIFSVYAEIAKRSYTDNRELIQSQFKSSRMIYMPRASHHPQCVWLGNDDCVWSGPAWLTTKYRLEQVYKNMEDFFRVTLQIRDFRWRDCLSELESVKAKQERQPAKVTEIYRRLMLDFIHHSNWDELRAEFEQRQLVFVSEGNSWHPLSSCIWAESRIRIPQKHSIATSYSETADFFTRILGVPRPDLGMHVQTLKDLGKSRSKDAQWLRSVKDTMMLVSSMDPKTGDLSNLHAAIMFPVKTRLGDVQPTSSQVEFAIVDRPEFDGLFPTIAVLDFTLQEVHTLKRFLLAMGLGQKHMSALVDEKTTVDGGSLDLSLTEFLRSRAYALFRCAVHYNSAKARDNDLSLFGQLRQAETLTSERISKSMTLVQNTQEYCVEQQKANFHLNESNERLQLYVPKRRSDRELCYLRQLPKRLLRFLAISDPAAEAVVSSIVNSSRLSIVDEILKDAGIIEIDGIQRPPELEDEEQPSDAAASSSEDSGSAHDMQTPSRSSGLSETCIVGESSSRNQHPFTNAFRPDYILRNPSPSPSPLPDPISTSESVQYARLLDHLITSASTAPLPSPGASTFSDTGHHHRNFGESIFGQRSLERDKKVGAAGELFVFELLSQLGLPSFGQDNWQSTIRKYVRVCNKYRGLEPWNGSETADITFKDNTNWLLHSLMALGYDMASHSALPNHAKFYLEVKTTTGDSNDPFYVSGPQYQRMKKYRATTDSPWSEIYIIIRVFNIEGDRVGLRLYVDPITAESKGDLHFTVDKWRVTPV